MTVAVTGGSGTITYQWQSSPNGASGWVNATGTGNTTTTYTPDSSTPGTTFYRVLINASNSDCQQAVSVNATAIIAPDLLVTTQPTNVNECVGGTNTTSVIVSGGSGTISYQWQSSTDGIGGWANAAGCSGRLRRSRRSPTKGLRTPAPPGRWPPPRPPSAAASCRG